MITEDQELRTLLYEMSQSNEYRNARHFVIPASQVSNALALRDFWGLDKYVFPKLKHEFGRIFGIPVVANPDVDGIRLVATQEADLLPPLEMPVVKVEGPKWEYLVKRINENADYRDNSQTHETNENGDVIPARWYSINDLGAEGWELVGFHADKVVFMRPAR